MSVSRKVSVAVSALISRVKGSDYQIDERVDPGYLASVLAERSWMKARGIARFPARGQRPFIGARVRIRSASRLNFGSGTTLGHGVYIDALAVDGVNLGRNCSVGRNTRIECTGSLKHLGVGLRVGDNVGLGTDCLYGCAGGITIGDDTIVGNYVTFHAENHLIADRAVPIRLQGVSHEGITVGRNCWIGAKATILDGARIGDGCVIAAGSVVTAGEYADFCIYGGTPARLLKQRP